MSPAPASGLDASVPTQLGRYHLRRRLAAGGMATVWLARATGAGTFEKVVAVKTLHEHMASNPMVVRMFIDEASIAARLDHPNVCQVFDFGESEGTYYLVMEYLVGESLFHLIKALISRGTAAGPGRMLVAARIIADAAEGLFAAHSLTDAAGRSLEVVHRDVSPQNIFVTFDGAVKVVDFGIARARERLEQTRTGDLKGKLPYMAPEQLQGATATHLVDQWSLGVVLWEFLALRRLFHRDDMAATGRAILSERLSPPSAIDPGCPKELDAIVMRALQRTPSQRYPDMRAFGRALRGWLAAQGEPVERAELSEWATSLCPQEKTSRTMNLQAVLAEPTAKTAPSRKAAVPVEPSPRRRVGPWLAAGAVAACAVAVGAWLVVRPQPFADPDLGAEAATDTAPVSLVAVEPMPPRDLPSAAVVEAAPDDAPTRAPAAVEPTPPTDSPTVAAAPAAVVPSATPPTPTARPAAARPTRSPAPQPKGVPRAPPGVPAPALPRVGIAGALRGGNVSVHRGSFEATLRLDGTVVGKAPLNLTVQPGAHRLEILDPSGHVAATQNLLIEVGVDYAVDLD